MEFYKLGINRRKQNIGTKHNYQAQEGALNKALAMLGLRGNAGSGDIEKSSPHDKDHCKKCRYRNAKIIEGADILSDPREVLAGSDANTGE